MVKKVGVLTSGGDAPGMNAAVYAVAKYGFQAGIEVYGIEDGYKGLMEKRISKLNYTEYESHVSKGGTILGTARLPEFKDVEVRKKAVEILKEFGIDSLIVIGGDGSYRGAQGLNKLGIHTIGIPGTIDNDVASTDYCIGFDTAMNTIVYALDHLRETSMSHRRCACVEIMGNHCPDLSIYSGIADAVDVSVTPVNPLSKEEVARRVNEMHAKTGKRAAIVLVTEKMELNVKDLAPYITEHTPYEGKWEILGRIQRGGSPSAYDRLLATSLGAYAIDLLVQGKTGVAVGVRENKFIYTDFDESQTDSLYVNGLKYLQNRQ